MFQLSLRLALRGEGVLIRLLLTALAVAVGVATLLAVVADFHAYQLTNNRPDWESTKRAPANQISGSNSDVELWNYSNDLFEGQIIKRLDVAALGPEAPVVPGIPALPQAGQFYVSPALASLLQTVPKDELGDRFPGSQIGIIGNQALSGPDELVVIVGYAPDSLVSLPHTVPVDAINTHPVPSSTTHIYQFAIIIGAITLLFPILILIATAIQMYCLQTSLGTQAELCHIRREQSD